MIRKNLIGIIAISAALRVYGLGTESLWLDEGGTVTQIQRGWTQLFDNPTQGPLFLVLAKLSMQWIGDSEWALRFLPMIFGIAFVPLIFLLARELFDERAAFWSSVFAAFNPFLIHFSQDARPYTLFLLTGTGSVYFLLRVIGQYSIWKLLGFLAFGVGALYSHAFGLFLFPLWLLIILLRLGIEKRGGVREQRAVLMGMGVAAILYLPICLRLYALSVDVMSGAETRAAWIARPDLLMLGGAINTYFFFPPLTAAVCLLIAYSWYSKRKSEESSSLWILTFIVGSSIVIPWVFSWVVTPSFVYRYTIVGSTGVLLAAGWALSRLDRMTLRIVGMSLFVLTVIPLYTYYSMNDKDPWRLTAAELLTGYRIGDVLVAQPDYLGDPLTYYLPDSIDVISVKPMQEPRLALSGLGRIWLVTAYGTEQRALTDSVIAAIHSDHREGLNLSMDERVEKNSWGHWMASVVIRRYDPITALDAGSVSVK